MVKYLLFFFHFLVGFGNFHVINETKSFHCSVSTLCASDISFLNSEYILPEHVL